MAEKKELKGSKTEANLMAAFAGECQATNKYTYYASKARKRRICSDCGNFRRNRKQRKEHAKIWFKLLHDGVGATRTTFRTPPQASIMNGPICTPALRKLPVRKALQELRHFLKALPKSKRNTRKDTKTLRKYRTGNRIQPRRGYDLAVQELRSYRNRQKGSENMPRLRAPEELFPD